MVQSPSWEANLFLKLVKKFPAFHGTRRFITALTSVRHLSLSWASPIQSIYPHPTSCRSILILSTHLRLGLPSCLLPSGFPTKTLYTTLSSPIRATCPAHPILLHFITRTILCDQYKSFSSSLCNLLHSPVTTVSYGWINCPMMWRPAIFLGNTICSVISLDLCSITLTYTSETETQIDRETKLLRIFERKVYSGILGPVYDNEKENQGILTNKEIYANVKKPYYNRDSNVK